MPSPAEFNNNSFLAAQLGQVLFGPFTVCDVPGHSIQEPLLHRCGDGPQQPAVAAVRAPVAVFEMGGGMAEGQTSLGFGQVSWPGPQGGRSL